MAFRLPQTSNVTKFIIIAEFIVVSYLLYALTKAVYTSYQIDQHIKTFEVENSRIEEENLRKTEDYAYYNSNAYMEKMAKQNLGLVNPGEEVVVIPSSSAGSTGIVGGFSKSDSDSGTMEISNPAKWWKFFFDIKQ